MVFESAYLAMTIPLPLSIGGNINTLGAGHSMKFRMAYVASTTRSMFTLVKQATLQTDRCFLQVFQLEGRLDRIRSDNHSIHVPQQYHRSAAL
ncbi:MAG: hypothetical protein CM1200mP20_12640 [Pseudomonadota bacterium]|nr:MAG: hypothetical protein CM1200mP20_12640 [Pseudomonadota bacterium]